MPKPSHLRSVDPTPAPAAQGTASRPSGVAVETVPTPGKRRKLSAAEEPRIVREAAACTQRGHIEAPLRREGIYSSLLTAWRKQLALQGSEALAGRKPGRKPKQDAKDRRIPELEKRSARLEEKLALAEKLIGLQEKASAILGVGWLLVERESAQLAEQLFAETVARRGAAAHGHDQRRARAWRHALRSGATSTAHIPEPERASQRDPLLGFSSGLPQTCWQLPRPLHGT
ncbi:hypothetical protein WME89_31015 [Sorangium sp. So ce321]|uniref:hypothetical protein n=1 Tax=Sorangium sp. So ce321 TaxID=3133300 RepID=UPI003F60AA1F